MSGPNIIHPYKNHSDSFPKEAGSMDQILHVVQVECFTRKRKLSRENSTQSHQVLHLSLKKA